MQMTFKPEINLSGLAACLAASVFALSPQALASAPAAADISAPCYSGPIGATVDIPAGSFSMGADNFYPEEGPVHQQNVDAFNIDAHEVTNAQFAAFIEATGYVTSAERATELGFPENGSAVFANAHWQFVPGADWRHPLGPKSSIEGRDRFPVVHVSQQDSEAYAAWRGRQLPSEVQNEYAARGGLDGADYSWGDTLAPDGQQQANTWQGIFPVADIGDDGYQGVAPVGCYKANGYGVYDLIGNVWELTSDSYYPRHGADDDPIRLEHPNGLDPRQPDVPVAVIKGGSYLCADNFCRRYRPAARHAQDAMLGTNHIGFRTVGPAGANE